MAIIINKNVKLVPVTRNTLKDLFSLVSDKNIVGHFQPYCKLPYSAFLNKFNKTRVKYFLIKKKETNILLGYAYWVKEPRFNSFEIGATIVPWQRGQGYGIKSHQALIKLLARYKGQRLQAIVASRNYKEIAVLKKCGFVCEGTLIKAGKMGNRYLNLCIYARIKN